MARDYDDTREELLRHGMAVLTEQGFGNAGIDGILRAVGVPKGSFYHYFASKEAFGLAVLERYDRYFAAKLDRHLLDASLPPLQRIRRFAEEARDGMAKYAYARGCLAGNLGQEVGQLPDSFRSRVSAIFDSWQDRLATCLQEAQANGELAAEADCQTLAEYFWIGWEGAVMRARLATSDRPIELFIEQFLTGLPR
ncbi:TetR/AcrR family transcriptional regulator [Marinobacterium aestuariivivens]|uniref:TetR/AcrR family transcriptional regulator n=1 Tax=Marinobacterium aestuariivivens TaxID=1698799 RepID=A0ABW1ZZ65_9GAMM